MSTTLLSIKTDEATKTELKAFARKLGVSSTALVNMLIKQALRDQRLELDVSLEPTPYLEKIMREADEDIKTGKTYGPFSSVDDMFNALEQPEDEA